MSDEQTTCGACGRTILALTAAEHGGRCVPCANGRRGQIEENRRLNAEQKAFRQSPEWKFWEGLVGTPFSEMSDAQRVYFATNLLRGEVYNGGFEQYFWNSSSDYAGHAARGLVEMNAANALEMLNAAHELVFGAAAPTAQRDRQKLLDNLSLDAHDALNALDQRFWADPDNLWERLMDYGAAAGLFPRPPQRD